MKLIITLIMLFSNLVFADEKSVLNYDYEKQNKMVIAIPEGIKKITLSNSYGSIDILKGDTLNVYWEKGKKEGVQNVIDDYVKNFVVEKIVDNNRLKLIVRNYSPLEILSQVVFKNYYVNLTLIVTDDIENIEVKINNGKTKITKVNNLILKSNAAIVRLNDIKKLNFFGNASDIYLEKIKEAKIETKASKLVGYDIEKLDINGNATDVNMDKVKESNMELNAGKANLKNFDKLSIKSNATAINIISLPQLLKINANVGKVNIFSGITNEDVYDFEIKGTMLDIVIESENTNTFMNKFGGVKLKSLLGSVYIDDQYKGNYSETMNTKGKGKFVIDIKMGNIKLFQKKEEEEKKQ